MRNCPNCNELVGDNVTTCFNCQYDFRLKMVPSAQQRVQQQVELARYERNEREKKAQKWAVIRKNAEYEYKTEIIQDRSDGTLNKDAINCCLEKYASDGWRLHSIFCNEIGKSASAISVVGFGFQVNATIDETIMVFERRVKEEE